MKDTYLESLQAQVFEAAKLPKKKPKALQPDEEPDDYEKEDMIVDKYHMKLWDVAKKAADEKAIFKRVKVAVSAFMSKIPKDERAILANFMQEDYESRSHESQSGDIVEASMLEALKPYLK